MAGDGRRALHGPLARSGASVCRLAVVSHLPGQRVASHRGYEEHASDIAFEHIPGVGHWIVEEAHDLVLERLRSFLQE